MFVATYRCKKPNSIGAGSREHSNQKASREASRRTHTCRYTSIKHTPVIRGKVGSLATPVCNRMHTRMIHTDDSREVKLSSPILFVKLPKPQLFQLKLIEGQPLINRMQKNPDLCPSPLEAELFMEPYYYSCHLQI